MTMIGMQASPESTEKPSHGASSDMSAALCGSEWGVALIASRESVLELLATIDAIIASVERPTVLDVLVNGNPELASGVADALSKRGGGGWQDLRDLRVWSLVLGDKANAWNQYLHSIWPGDCLAYFVDGHCRPSPRGLALLDEALSIAPKALAATALPSMSRSAQQWRDTILNDGGIGGGFLALRSSVMADLRNRGFRLPLGLYGFDATLGAVLAFGLDPARNAWDMKGRIAAHPQATWYSTEKQWWRLSDLRTQLNRLVKVALRVLVGQALRDAFEPRQLQPEQLPRTTADIVLDWVARKPQEVWRVYRRSLLSVLALRQLRVPRDWSAADLPPSLIYSQRRNASAEL